MIIEMKKDTDNDRKASLLEERMHVLIADIAECDRILRLAEEARQKIEKLRNELAEVSKKYTELRGDVK